ITYNVFDKTESIEQANKRIEFVYGPDLSRKIMKTYEKEGGNFVLKKTKYYILDNTEIEVDHQTGENRTLSYIANKAIWEQNTATGNQLYYLHKDYQGSLLAVTYQNGNVAQRYAYDPWGRRRDPGSWHNLTASEIEQENFLFARGYTGHEHLDAFGLINMNGRMYDPLLGRMLSPDNYVQAPDNSQNFNRYSYALNNPLVYTDPDGEWLHLLFGAIIGGTTNWLDHGAEFSAKGLGYFGIGALAGGLSAGVGAGIGAAYAGSAIHSGGFAAGFLGTATISSTGFVVGAISGTAAGLTNGLIVGSGNKMMSGQNFIDAIRYAGFEQALLQGAAGFSYGGLMGSVDAMKNGEDWLTEGPRPKINMITDGKDVITQDQASSSDILQKKGTINLPVTNEEYAIEIKAPKGYRMTGGGASYVYGNDKLFHKMIQVKNNSQIITFPFGTPYGGAYGAIVERSARVINVHGDLVLFFANKRSYSTLFWYLSLLN
ncbi:MAG: RHS repeat-associated core domain-containing protein, partial [Bacteroidales bacterium]|nr:RHS repeat-associated core domain-containing protein [Bacteroidales bacterium]